MNVTLIWAIYIWFFIGMLLFSFLGRLVLYWRMPGTISKLDLAEGTVGVLAIVPLLGFLHQRAVAPRFAWMLLSVVAATFAVLQCFMPKTRKLFAAGRARAFGVKALEAAVGLPGLYAVAYYAFFEPSLWR
jgi:uncharacterized SAM-binding protein YcdF (DUF218 family)